MFQVFFLIILSCVLAQHEKNACTTFKAYFDNKNANPKCWFDPDVDASPEDRAENHDLSLERHYIHTKDNWILITFRLKSSNGIYGKQPVFLQHGLSTDATQWTVNGNKSIAYFLAKQGFDVWLGNFRGSEFSEHEIWTRNNPEFWDFSIDEHGLQDLPSNFKYIQSKAKKKLIYIGHSMGGTAIAMYLSTEPVEAVDLIKHTILISPSLYMRDLKGIFGTGYINVFYNFLPMAPKMNMNVLFSTNSFERNFVLDYCKRSYEDFMICINILLLTSGKGGYPVSPERIFLGITASKNTCFKTSFHYAQLINSGEFRKFDYGTKGNLLRYNSSIPPSYDLSKMTTDMSWIYGKYDTLATKKDCLENFERFKKPNWNIYEINYNHLNFLIDNRYSDKTVLPLLMNIINKAN